MPTALPTPAPPAPAMALVGEESEPAAARRRRIAARIAGERAAAERHLQGFDHAALDRRARAIAAEIARVEEMAKAAGDRQYMNIRKFEIHQMSRNAKSSLAAGRRDDGDLNAPLRALWAVLRPSWATLFREEAEAVAMLAICVVRIAEFTMQVQPAIERSDSSLVGYMEPVWWH